MNSFCNTVYVIVLLLRRRGAGERGEWKGAGHDGKEEKRKRGLFSLPIVHWALNFEYPVGASEEERGDRGFPKVIAPWIYSYNLY